VLEKEEKWRPRDMEVPMRAKMEPHLVGDDDDEASSDGVKRSPMPSLAARPNKRPMGVKQAKELKGRKSGDDDIKKAMEAMVSACKAYTKEKRLEKAMVSVAEERRAAAEERRLALEEKKFLWRNMREYRCKRKNSSSWTHPNSMRDKRSTSTFAVMKCWQRRECWHLALHHQ
jgi:hypothetical protein